MNTAMSQEELEEMLDNAVREVTSQAAGVHLHPSGAALSGDLCTIHISFEKGFHTTLTLYADTALFSRMAKNVFGDVELSPQDLEDFSKEYFNILCGKIAAYLFRTTRIAARFGTPTFYHGRYTPENHQMQFALTYTDDQREGAQLTHHIPHPRQDTAE